MRHVVVLWIFFVVLLGGCASQGDPAGMGTPPPTDEHMATPAPPGATRDAPSGTPGPGGDPHSPGPGMPPQQAPTGRFRGCEGEGTVMFERSPMRLEDVQMMIPYGLLAGAHVTPIDHMYFSPLHGSARDAFEVRAIGDGVIYSIQPRDIMVDTGEARAREWRMDIAHTCTFTSYFDLLTSITPEIEAAYNASRDTSRGPWNGFPVKAGDLVGRIGAQTLDFAVYDYNVTLPGFIVPEHYDYESWKVHTVDPFPYFPTEVRDAMLAKMVRTAEPRAGKIDHDVDGTLQGNWFKVGTNGYQGLTQSYYWEGHLAAVPDTYDPAHVLFSVGNFDGRAAQFGVKGNPDPRLVTPGSGVHVWELTHFEHRDNVTGAYGFGPGGIQPGNGVTAENFDQVLGVAVLEMTGPRALRVELFPGATAASVIGFSGAESGWRYER